MKVQRGLTITDLPGIKSITVQHDYAYPTAVITPEYNTEYPWQFELKAITTLRDALDLCIAEMQRDAAVPASTKPRVFTAGDPEPVGNVSAVVDRDGDRWGRKRGGWVLGSSDGTYSWEYVLGRWSPLTEVPKTEAPE